MNTPCPMILDLASAPILPAGCSLAAHAVGPVFPWDARKIHLHSAGNRNTKKALAFRSFRKQLLRGGEHILINANAAHFIRDNQARITDIPEANKKKLIILLGTTFHYDCGRPGLDTRGGNKFSHFLYWTGARWEIGIVWMTSWVPRNSYVAVMEHES